MKKSAVGLIPLLAISSIAFAKSNVNTAPESESEALKDIGPVKAKSIIEYRQKHGAFKSLKDLEKVPGIAAATVDKIKDQVTVDGTSTREKAASSAASAKHKVPRN